MIFLLAKPDHEDTANATHQMTFLKDHRTTPFCQAAELRLENMSQMSEMSPMSEMSGLLVNANASTLPSPCIAEEDAIWKNISKSTERLEREWAKMPPLPLPNSICKKDINNSYKSKQKDKNKDVDRTKTADKIVDNSFDEYKSVMDKTNDRDNKKFFKIPRCRVHLRALSCQNERKPTNSHCRCHNHCHEKHSHARNLRRSSSKDALTLNSNRDHYCTQFKHSLRTPSMKCITRTRSCSSEKICRSPLPLLKENRTEPLTWLQQHLVLKHTVSKNNSNTCRKFCSTEFDPKDMQKITAKGTSSRQNIGGDENAGIATIKDEKHIKENIKKNIKDNSEQKNIEKNIDKNIEEKNIGLEKRCADFCPEGMKKNKPIRVNINVRVLPKSNELKRSQRTRTELRKKAEKDDFFKASENDTEKNE